MLVRSIGRDCGDGLAIRRLIVGGKLVSEMFRFESDLVSGGLWIWEEGGKRGGRDCLVGSDLDCKH